jgi:excisionase family DNA binding protein
MPRLLTIKETALMMKVSRQTIYSWINSGKLKPIKTPGGRLRIPEDQLIITKLEPAEGAISSFFPIRDISDLVPEAPEQLGTKEKSWFAYSEKHWYWHFKGDRFLFKAGREGTGENWAEKVACELCKLLELPHAEYDLATYQAKKGVVTPNFVPNGARLELGNEILARYVSGYEKTKRFSQTQHTLSRVFWLVRRKEVELPIGFSGFDNINSAIDVFVGYLMLDAWIANQDRHHENWGYVIEPSNGSVHLAPTFDHASSLGRNESDENRVRRLNTKDTGMSTMKYVERAKSAFYRTQDDTKPLSTIDAFRIAAQWRPDAARTWFQKLVEISLPDIRAIIDRVPHEEMSDIAKEFTQQILDLNRQRLLAINL